MKRLSVLVIGALLSGCSFRTLPDPNDPTDQAVSPDRLQANLATISDALLERRLRREISTEQYRELMATAANDMVKDLHLKSVPSEEAWQYGEIFRAAKSWKAADVLLSRAVEYAKSTHNEDRRINDTLRLANTRAAEGDRSGALELTRQTLDASPADSAPILPALLFEIVPLVRSQGVDLDLAQILEAAAEKHLLTQVDSERPEGQNFILARPTHVATAYSIVAELYDRLGKHDLAIQALQRAEMARNQIDELTKWAEKKYAVEHPRAAPLANQSRSSSSR